MGSIEFTLVDKIIWVIGLWIMPVVITALFFRWEDRRQEKEYAAEIGKSN